MTEEEADALGKRLSACKHFRPMPGLKDMQGRTWDDSLLWRWNPGVDVPDLRQPASMGILLACVREAYNDPMLYVEWLPFSRKAMVTHTASTTFHASVDTEAEALLVTLEAKP